MIATFFKILIWQKVKQKTIFKLSYTITNSLKKKVNKKIAPNKKNFINKNCNK